MAVFGGSKNAGGEIDASPHEVMTLPSDLAAGQIAGETGGIVAVLLIRRSRQMI